MARLEVCLSPSDLPRLLRKPLFGRRAGRGTAMELVWHDTANGALAAQQLSLCRTGAGWRLERSAPRPGELWLAAMPPPPAAEAAELTGLGPLPGPLIPLAGFQGERRLLRIGSDGQAMLTVLNGALRGVAQAQPVCRLLLEGPPSLLAMLTTEWAASLSVLPPLCSLATEALAVARETTPPRRVGGPQVPVGLTTADAFALVVGQLAETILAGVTDAAAGLSAAPVHEMRVAVRRLRSALSVFARVIGDPALAELRDRLAALAEILGGARDWDVFLAGAGPEMAAALPDDPRIRGLLADAARQRASAYNRLREEFASPAFRQLGMALIHLATLRLWEVEADDMRLALLGSDAATFAKQALARQHRRLMAAGPEIGERPAEELHTLRKQGKRLRYTAEFFTSFYDSKRTRRFINRMSHFQDVVGQLNDGAAAATLLQPLSGGAARQFAIGAVQGFTAARSTQSRAAVVKSWAKLRRAKPFWL